MTDRISHLMVCRRPNPDLRERGDYYICPDCGRWVREADETVRRPADFGPTSKDAE